MWTTVHFPVVLLLLSTPLSILPVCSYKILHFAPTISRSHLIANGRIADELTRAGHDVVLFEPDFTNLLDSIRNTSKLARRLAVRGFPTDLADMLSVWSAHVFDEETIVSYNQGQLAWHHLYDQNCRRLIDNEQVMEMLRREQFEAYIGEQINFCGHGVAHALDIKIKLMISSCPVFETLSSTLGYSTPLAYVPIWGMDIDPLETYLSRARNLLYAAINSFVYSHIHWRTTNIFREKYGPQFPSLEELAAESDMILVNTDEFVDIPRPVAPNMVNVGGLGAGDFEQMELGEIFTQEMSKGADGVVLFSLGTVVNVTYLPTVFESIVELAKAFPSYYFIARSEKEDLHSRQVAKDVPNLSIHHWIPQPAVLRHLRLRAFISHGGYNSLMEAAWFGVPVVSVPFFLDQFKNSRAVELSGWGVQVSKYSLQNRPSLLIAGLGKALESEKFKSQAQRISRLIRSKPVSASQRLVNTIEFAISNGGVKELLMEGRKMSFVHFNNLDVILPFVVSVLVFSWLGIRTIVQGVRLMGVKLKKE